MNTIIKIKKDYYYGWTIVIIAALGLFFSGPGQTYSNSAFIDSYIRDFGWSRTLVSNLYSSATLIAGLFLFLIGKLIDKHGHKNITILVSFSLGLACVWSSFINSPAMLFIGFLMLRFFGQGSMTLIPSTLVPQWFIKRRTLAFSLFTIGGVVSSAVLPPLNIYMIEKWGWPAAWWFWAILLWFLFMPLAFIFIKNKPEDIGLLPDNKKESLEVSSGVEGNVINDEANDIYSSYTLKEAMKTRAFWLMMFCQAIPSLINTGITFHFLSIIGSKGLPNTAAALVLSVIALVSFPVTMIAGIVLQRVKVHYAIAFSFFLHLISLIVLMYGHAFYVIIIFGVLNGLASGFLNISNNVVWANYYGRRHLGSIRGLSMTASVIGSAFGPLPVGMAFDMLGGYTEVIAGLAVVAFLGILAAAVAPKPRKRDALQNI